MEINRFFENKYNSDLLGTYMLNKDPKSVIEMYYSYKLGMEIVDTFIKNEGNYNNDLNILYKDTFQITKDHLYSFESDIKEQINEGNIKFKGVTKFNLESLTNFYKPFGNLRYGLNELNSAEDINSLRRNTKDKMKPFYNLVSTILDAMEMKERQAHEPQILALYKKEKEKLIKLDEELSQKEYQESFFFETDTIFKIKGAGGKYLPISFPKIGRAGDHTARVMFIAMIKLLKQNGKIKGNTIELTLPRSMWMKTVEEISNHKDIDEYWFKNQKSEMKKYIKTHLPEHTHLIKIGNYNKSTKGYLIRLKLSPTH